MSVHFWQHDEKTSDHCALTNEDVIDLYNRAKIGAHVVVLGAQQS